MSREISVRELRNHTADVVKSVRSGERVSLTVNRMPVADIVPHQSVRSPWVPAAKLREFLQGNGADPQLLDDLADIRGALIDEP